MYWYDKAVFYHIYPLGYCGCAKDNDFASAPADMLSLIENDIPRIKEAGFTAIYFGPMFESSHHGYDTADYLTIDRRLGTNADFKRLCDKLHSNNIKVVLDGVFNHVGRDFWAFRDIREKGLSSRYKDWFQVREGNSPFNDGFYYDGWEGHYELVKLNLWNPEVKDYLKSVVGKWREEFGIDGLRLDVAYCLDLNFLRELHGFCKGFSEDFWLMGETLHGDYNKWMNSEMLDSVTNYECYKGLYSSFNELNMFEISYSLNRQFGKENWCLYTGKNLYSFVDNHDVSRIATMLKEPKHLSVIYSLLFTMPGIPAVYYGSEYAAKGEKKMGDDELRKPFSEIDKTDTGLLEHIKKLIKLRTESTALAKGDYAPLQILNRQYSFIRSYGSESVITLLNADNAAFTFSLNMNNTKTDIISGKSVDLSEPIELDGCSSMILA